MSAYRLSGSDGAAFLGVLQVRERDGHRRTDRRSARPGVAVTESYRVGLRIEFTDRSFRQVDRLPWRVNP
jgi:hypothetical protein